MNLSTSASTRRPPMFPDLGIIKGRCTTHLAVHFVEAIPHNAVDAIVSETRLMEMLLQLQGQQYCFENRLDEPAA